MPKENNIEPVLEALGDTMEKDFDNASSSLENMTASELAKLVRKLRGRMVQLEMQNEELRKNQMQLATSREAYRSLWETAPVGYLILDPDGTVIVVNRAGRKLFYKREEDILKKPLALLVSPQDQVTVNYLLSRALQTKKVERGEVRLPTRGEPPRFCQMECSVLGNEIESDRFQVVLTDITHQKTIEEECRGHMERLRLALEGGQLGMWDRDVYTGKTVWSPMLYELLGRDPNGPEITSETFFQYIEEEDRPRVREKVSEWFQSSEMDFREEFRVLRDDGQMRWLAAVGRAFRDSSGNICRITGINYDITERKQAEQELKQLNIELEKRVVERTKQAENRSRKLQQLTLELAEAEDKERQRISSILHDHLQQNLVSLN